MKKQTSKHGKRKQRNTINISKQIWAIATITANTKLAIASQGNYILLLSYLIKLSTQSFIIIIIGCTTKIRAKI